MAYSGRFRGTFCRPKVHERVGNSLVKVIYTKGNQSLRSVKGPKKLTSAFYGCEKDKKTLWFSVFIHFQTKVQLPQLTLGRTCKFIPSPWYKGCGGADWAPSQSFWYCAVFGNDFAFNGKPLILLTRWGIFYGWWRYWRPVTSPTIVTIFAAILDFTKNRPVPSSKNPHF